MCAGTLRGGAALRRRPGVAAALRRRPGVAAARAAAALCRRLGVAAARSAAALESPQLGVGEQRRRVRDRLSEDASRSLVPTSRAAPREVTPRLAGRRGDAQKPGGHSLSSTSSLLRDTRMALCVFMIWFVGVRFVRTASIRPWPRPATARRPRRRSSEWLYASRRRSTAAARAGARGRPCSPVL